MRFRFLLLFVAFVFLDGLHLVFAEQTNETFVVHGRLCYYNGTPSCRIWIVRTKRLLGVFESIDSGSEEPTMPKELKDLMSWDKDVFANFVVQPLTPYKQGVMQTVRIVSASKIVVTENGKTILRKDKL
jgi:hypothetical protein